MKNAPIIFCVDDDPAIQTLISRILKGTGWDYELITAIDGLSAVDIFSSKEIALVLLDVNLPLKSGVEVCRHFRSLNASIPILAMSANAVNRQAILAAGATLFIDKPFSPAQLIVSLAKFFPVAAPHQSH